MNFVRRALTKKSKIATANPVTAERDGLQEEEAQQQAPGERFHSVLPEDAAQEPAGVRDPRRQAGRQVLARDVQAGALQVHHAGEEAPLIRLRAAWAHTAPPTDDEASPR